MRRRFNPPTEPHVPCPDAGAHAPIGLPRRTSTCRAPPSPRASQDPGACTLPWSRERRGYSHPGGGRGRRQEIPPCSNRDPARSTPSGTDVSGHDMSGWARGGGGPRREAFNQSSTLPRGHSFLLFSFSLSSHAPRISLRSLLPFFQKIPNRSTKKQGQGHEQEQRARIQCDTMAMRGDPLQGPSRRSPGATCCAAVFASRRIIPWQATRFLPKGSMPAGPAARPGTRPEIGQRLFPASSGPASLFARDDAPKARKGVCVLLPRPPLAGAPWIPMTRSWA